MAYSTERKKLLKLAEVIQTLPAYTGEELGGPLTAHGKKGKKKYRPDKTVILLDSDNRDRLTLALYVLAECLEDLAHG